jgi:hypothetical protein
LSCCDVALDLHSWISSFLTENLIGCSIVLSASVWERSSHHAARNPGVILDFSAPFLPFQLVVSYNLFFLLPISILVCVLPKQTLRQELVCNEFTGRFIFPRKQHEGEEK